MFVAPFAAPFPSPVASSGAAAVPWYLAGGVAAANCKAAYQPIGAASLAASYSNLANPGTNDAAPGVAPTWASATGWTFNGTTQYLTTGLVAVDGWTIVLRYSGYTVAAGDHIPIGARTSGTNGIWFGLGPTTGGYGYYAHAGTLSYAGTSGDHVVGIAGKGAFLDGSSVGTISAGSNTTTYGLFIGCLNNGGTALLGGHFAWENDILAAAVYNITLTGAQVAAITTAMQALTG